jgi:hypothetical protein
MRVVSRLRCSLKVSSTAPRVFGMFSVFLIYAFQDSVTPVCTFQPYPSAPRGLTPMRTWRWRLSRGLCFKQYGRQPSESSVPISSSSFEREVETGAVQSLKCEGCGVELQSAHEDALGFIPHHVHKRVTPHTCCRHASTQISLAAILKIARTSTRCPSPQLTLASF